MHRQIRRLGNSGALRRILHTSMRRVRGVVKNEAQKIRGVSPRAYRPLSTMAGTFGVNQCGFPSLVSCRSRWDGGIAFSQGQCRFSTTTTSSERKTAVRILYGTTSGTAQLFAMDLAQALEDAGDVEAPLVESLDQYKSLPELLQQQTTGGAESDTVTIFLVSTSGVGEPPASIRDFYNNTVLNTDSGDLTTIDQPFPFAIFGLGNSVAHPNHYNVVGKRLHEFLEKQHNTSAVLPLALGDNGDCLEDDFDQWQELVVEYFRHRKESDGRAALEEEGRSSSSSMLKEDDKNTEADASNGGSKVNAASTANNTTQNTANMRPCAGAKSGSRYHSTKHSFLILDPPSKDERPMQHRRGDLFEFCPEWYQQNGNSTNAKQFKVVYQRHLSTGATSSGLHEIGFRRDPETDVYETGDHFVLYPRNDNSIVEAYLSYMDLIPKATVSLKNLVGDGGSKYPFPLGLTVQETLSFCVDLNATPTPQFARLLTQNSLENYKEQIFNPRRTVLDLLYEYGACISLEDLLYNQPLLSPRYYSIASSPSSEQNNQLSLTYRPIHYLTNRGVLREGTCTSFMSRLTEGSTIVGEIRSNPKFRFPQSPQTPILMVAGGCGVAPIHSMLQERLAQFRTMKEQTGTEQPFGKALLFLGFRDAEDVAYPELIEECLANGILDRAYITTWDCDGEGGYLPDSHIGWSCGKVTDALHERGLELWNHFEEGGHTFLCGGARTFGAAVEKEVVDIIHQHGSLSQEESSEYLRQMIAAGRFQEDLAD